MFIMIGKSYHECNLESIVIMKTNIPIEKVRDMSDEELDNILDKLGL